MQTEDMTIEYVMDMVYQITAISVQGDPDAIFTEIEDPSLAGRFPFTEEVRQMMIQEILDRYQIFITQEVKDSWLSSTPVFDYLFILWVEFKAAIPE